MGYQLGGMTITNTGWLGPQAVYVDFVSTYTSGYLWQLYANRTLIGVTTLPSERRIVGMLQPSGVPAVLTLLLVPTAEVLIDYGQQIPAGPWNRYLLEWTEAAGDADLDRWEITSGVNPGDEPDPTNVLGAVPYYGDRAYSFALPPLDLPGPWKYAVTPRDNAKPNGNAGTPVVVEIEAATPPPDVAFNDDGTRFSVSITGGVLTASFTW